MRRNICEIVLSYYFVDVSLGAFFVNVALL